jgi:peptidoglycan hydrolase CwlO-like protein
MNRLGYINLFGVLALAVLCAMQWQSNRALNLERNRFEKTTQTQAAELKAQAKTVQGLSGDLESFKAQFTRADKESKDGARELASLQRKLAQLEREKTQLMESVTNWAGAVTVRDERLKDANQRINDLAEQLNDSIRKFNSLATNYNQSVQKMNELTKKYNEVVEMLNEERRQAAARAAAAQQNEGALSK